MNEKYDLNPTRARIGREFIARRLHSLAGFFFLLFLCEHLFTNSQATLFLGDDGKGFIDSVNWIHSLPYLQVIELTFIGLPLAVHIWWGIDRIYQSKINSIPSDGTKPALAYSRNIAYTWQRITSILLIVAIGLHVYYMRFLQEPKSVSYGVFSEHFVKISVDHGLYTLAPRLNLTLYDQDMIEKAQKALSKEHPPHAEIPPFYNKGIADEIKLDERYDLEKRFVAAMQDLQPASNEVVAMCNNFGTASLMMVRDTFKSVWFCILYSLFVIIACFHAANGLWTFAITWGISLSERSRKLMRLLSNLLMVLLLFFGLAAIWGVYWINLRY